MPPKPLKKDIILAMFGKHPLKDIAAAVKSDVDYVRYVIRNYREAPVPTIRRSSPPDPKPVLFATPRPCGPFEELAWKLREREAKRHSIYFEGRT